MINKLTEESSFLCWKIPKIESLSWVSNSFRLWSWTLWGIRERRFRRLFARELANRQFQMSGSTENLSVKRIKIIFFFANQPILSDWARWTDQKTFRNYFPTARNYFSKKVNLSNLIRLRAKLRGAKPKMKERICGWVGG